MHNVAVPNSPGLIGAQANGIADPGPVNPVPDKHRLQLNPQVVLGGQENIAASNPPAISALVNPIGAIGANPVPDVNQFLATMQKHQAWCIRMVQGLLVGSPYPN